MYPIATIKMAVCLVDIVDDDVSQNHCVSNCSSTVHLLVLSLVGGGGALLYKPI